MNCELCCNWNVQTATEAGLCADVSAGERGGYASRTFWRVRKTKGVREGTLFSIPPCLPRSPSLPPGPVLTPKVFVSGTRARVEPSKAKHWCHTKSFPDALAVSLSLAPSLLLPLSFYLSLSLSFYLSLSLSSSLLLPLPLSFYLSLSSSLLLPLPLSLPLSFYLSLSPTSPSLLSFRWIKVFEWML